MVGSITRRRYSFGAHLVVFALLVVLPVTLVAGVLLVHSVDTERTQAEVRLRQLAAALSENIDRDVERHILVLNTLSTLPSFGSDWRAFDERARRALQGDGYIVVADRSFAQKLNTYVPYGRQPARTGDLETAERIVVSRKPEVSNVFTSLVTGGRVINIDVPILRNGEVEYILMYGRPVGHLNGIMREQALEPGWASSVFDRHGNLIATVADTAPRGPGRRGGISRFTDASGNAILRATHTSRLTGWTVTIDVPLSVVMRDVNSTLLWWVLLALGAVLVAILLGLVFGQFLSRQMRTAATYAGTIVHDEPVTPPEPATLREIGLIIEVLQSAAIQLRAGMERQRLLSRELNHRVKNLLSVVQAVVKRTLSDAHPAAAQSRDLLLERLQALARTQDLLTRSDWADLPLRRIVDMEVAPFADRVECDGPDVLVSSGHVQSFGLLIHELTTNAVKYGALRDGAGTVAVQWKVEEGATSQRLNFRWKEHCVPTSATPTKVGFGMTLLASVFRAPDTIHRLEVEPDGFEFTLDVALELVTEKGSAAGPSGSPAPAAPGAG